MQSEIKKTRKTQNFDEEIKTRDFILVNLLLLILTNFLVEKQFHFEECKIRQFYETIKLKQFKKIEASKILDMYLKSTNLLAQSELECELNKLVNLRGQTNCLELLLETAGNYTDIFYIGPKFATNNTWIIKPANSSKGQNIIVFNKINDVRDTFKSICVSQDWVIQKYIENPLLIAGRKFDIRFYVLLTSLVPLTVWTYDDFYIRMSAVKYNPNELSDPAMHLTNFSVSKKVEISGDEIFPERMLSKTEFRNFVEENFGRNKFEKIETGILKVAQRVFEMSSGLIQNRRNSFELLGLDMMVDSQFEIFLLEINASPSMECGTSVTRDIVPRLTRDLVELIFDRDFGRIRDGQEQIGGWKVLIDKSDSETKIDTSIGSIAQIHKVQNLKII